MNIKLDTSPTVTNSGGTTSKCQLNMLISQATAKFAYKDYDAAAELFSRATELQAEINGEMSPENADLLYSYGRCLYLVAISSSDVFGHKIMREAQPEDAVRRDIVTKRDDYILTNFSNDDKNSLSPNVSTTTIDEADIASQARAKSSHFQSCIHFTGDDNDDDSERENGVVDADETDINRDLDDDDFTNAFEVLDLARLLLQRKIRDIQLIEGGNPLNPDSSILRQLKEKLADTFDLQAEISLEGERFSTAVEDLKAALQLKKLLFPQHSSLIAEAHYKLSLALEFMSITLPTAKKDVLHLAESGHLNGIRDEAVSEMEAAIASCRLRIQREQKALIFEPSQVDDSRLPKVTKETIEEVKEMVNDMEQKVRHPAKGDTYFTEC